MDLHYKILMSLRRELEEIKLISFDDYFEELNCEDYVFINYVSLYYKIIEMFKLENQNYKIYIMSKGFVTKNYIILLKLDFQTNEEMTMFLLQKDF